MQQHTKKILIIDDEELLRDMLVTVLTDEGYDVDSASNGEEACKLLTNNYDLLVTDLFMPKVNGFDLIAKSQLVSPQTKTILVSGGGKDLVAKHDSQHVEYLGKELNVSLFLIKPWDLHEMLSNIKTLLQD